MTDSQQPDNQDSKADPPVSLWAELKHRKVMWVATTYAAIGERGTLE